MIIPKPSHLVLIGGGSVMLHTAKAALARSLDVKVVLAPRHAEEPLPDNTITVDAFRSLGLPVAIIDNINTSSELAKGGWSGAQALALCYGPAWIFGEHVRSVFGAGMINYNPIPIPRYLGGAHYTWQILNGDHSGGCILQLITEKLDRGPILRSLYFDIPSSARTPADYFEVYNNHGCRLLDETLDAIIAGQHFELRDFAELDSRRLYLPRLFTLHNGYIDWRWTGAEIERFCCGFDCPYPGAGTFVDGREIRLKDVWFEPGERFHPFLSGLIVRRLNDKVWASVADGLLRIGDARVQNGDNAIGLLREGRRLATPPEKLYETATYRPKLSGKGIS